jgi:hypothetical protein
MNLKLVLFHTIRGNSNCYTFFVRKVQWQLVVILHMLMCVALEHIAILRVIMTSLLYTIYGRRQHA